MPRAIPQPNSSAVGPQCLPHERQPPPPPAPSYCSVEEGPAPSRRIMGAACLPGPSSQPVWISSSTGITFSSGSHRPPLGLQAIFLLHWPRAALLVSPEVAHSDKNPDKSVRRPAFFILGFLSPWFLQCPEPISPGAPPQEPGCPNPPCLQDPGSGWGGTAQPGFPRPAVAGSLSWTGKAWLLAAVQLLRKTKVQGRGLLLWSAGDTH